MFRLNLTLLICLCKILSITCLDSCITPDNQRGNCKLLSQCESLKAIAERKYHSRDEIALLQKSVCGGFQNNVIKTCCPLVEKTQTRGVIFIDKVDDGNCSTPDNQNGECISLTGCHSQRFLLQQPNLSSGQLNFLQKSICGFEGFIPRVCCAGINFAQSPADAKIENILSDTDTCGILKQDKIAPGQELKTRGYPWEAELNYEKSGGEIIEGACAGTLINHRYVLTAAQCVKAIPKAWKLVSVTLGKHASDTGMDCQQQKTCSPRHVTVKVRKAITHENYNPDDSNRYHDIALLRLSKNVDYSDHVKPICLLPLTALSLMPGNGQIIAGWHPTEKQNSSSLHTQLPLVDFASCASQYSQAEITLVEGQLCAGGGKSGSCTGEAGASLMARYRDANRKINWYAVGIVSFGPTPCESEDWPAVYTNVAKYLLWINSKIRP